MLRTGQVQHRIMFSRPEKLLYISPLRRLQVKGLHSLRGLSASTSRVRCCNEHLISYASDVNFNSDPGGAVFVCVGNLVEECRQSFGNALSLDASLPRLGCLSAKLPRKVGAAPDASLPPSVSNSLVPYQIFLSCVTALLVVLAESRHQIHFSGLVLEAKCCHQCLW